MGKKFIVGHDTFFVEEVCGGVELYKNGEVYESIEADCIADAAPFFKKVIIKQLKKDKNEAIKQLISIIDALEKEYSWGQNLTDWVTGTRFKVGENVYSIIKGPHKVTLHKYSDVTLTFLNFQNKDAVIKAFKEYIISDLEFDKTNAIHAIRLAYNCLARKKEWSKYLYVEDEG